MIYERFLVAELLGMTKTMCHPERRLPGANRSGSVDSRGILQKGT